MIADTASSADPVVCSIETEGLFVDNLRSRFIADVLAKRTSPLSLADQARLLLVMGLTDQLEKFLDHTCNDGLRNPQVGDPVLEDMRAAL